MDSWPTLLDLLRNPAPKEKPRDRQILLAWLGLQAGLPTLDEIGGEWNITRERARQVKNRSLKFSRERLDWVRLVEDRVLLALDSRSRPLFVALLDQEGEFLRGLESNDSFWSRFCRDLSDKVHLVQSELGLCLSRGRQEDLEEARALIEAGLEKYVGQRLQEGALVALVGAIASSQGIPEFSDELSRWARKRLVFLPTSFDNPETASGRILWGLRGSAARLCQQLLVLSPRPLHIQEVRQAFTEATGEDVSEMSARTALSSIGFPFARSTYGTFDHLTMSTEVQSSLSSRVDEIVSGGGSERQWHALEILAELAEEGFSLPEGLDQHTLTVILHKGSDLKYLGRCIWAPEEESEDRRRHVADIAETLLLRAGRPMTTDELKAGVRAVRGVGSFLMMLSRGDVGRVRPGLWGIIPRDFSVVSSGKQGQVLDYLEMTLSELGMGLHQSELLSFLPETGIETAGEDLAWEVVELARRDSRFRVGRGQIVGLSNWEDLGRLTPREAVADLAAAYSAPLSMEKIRLEVRERLGREFSHNSLYSLLNGAGFVFNDELCVWEMTEEEDDEDSQA